MRVALVQADLFWNEPEKNIENFKKAVGRSAEKGAELIILPEMFTTGSSFPTGDDAKKAGELGARFLRESAEELNVIVGGSLPIEKKGKVTNSFLLFGSEGLVTEYQKTHLFSYWEEDKKYASGETVETVNVKDFRITPLVCYDLRFPQLSAPVANDTDLYIFSANWPASREDHWRTLLIARAIENQAFVMGVNRVGESPDGEKFGGSSMLVAPSGEVLRRGSDREEIIISDINVEEVAQTREQFPCLKDRRDELYKKLMP